MERDTNLYFAASKMLVGPSFGRVERPTATLVELTTLGEAAGNCTVIHGKQRPYPAAPTGEAGQISGSYQERGEGARRPAGMSSTWSAFRSAGTAQVWVQGAEALHLHCSTESIGLRSSPPLGGDRDGSGTVVDHC